MYRFTQLIHWEVAKISILFFNEMLKSQQNSIEIGPKETEVKNMAT